MTKKFFLEEKMWLYPGKAGWFFVTIPTEIANEIDFLFGHAKRGWGSLKVTVTIGKTKWATSIFPDKKTHTYLLPLKKDVRKNEQIEETDIVSVCIELTS